MLVVFLVEKKLSMLDCCIGPVGGASTGLVRLVPLLFGLLVVSFVVVAVVAGAAKEEEDDASLRPGGSMLACLSFFCGAAFRLDSFFDANNSLFVCLSVCLCSSK